MSDYCDNCGDFIQYEAYCWDCHDGVKKSDADRTVISDAEAINTTFDRPIRIMVRPIRRDGAEWKWSISVNIGGWKKGETANVSSMTITGGIAYGLRLLNGEIEE